MNISNYNIGKTITWLRKNANMTQQQLASVLNVTHQAVSKWENGLALPDFSAMLAMSKLFGVTMEQIITGSIPGRVQEEETYAFDSVYNFAGKAVKAAQELGDTIAKGVSKVFSNTEGYPDDFSEDSAAETIIVEETEDSSKSETHNSMSLESLIDLAPFMSKDKLTEELLSCEDTPTLAQLCRLAPYLNSETIEALLTRYSGEINADVLARLAPFIKKEQLFKLIMKCPDALTLNNLRRFAPFLKRGMVDTLVEMITKAKQTVTSDEIRIQANTVFDSIREKLSNAVKSVTESDEDPQCSEDTDDNLDNSSNSAERTPEFQDKTEIKIVSSEFKDKIARAALNARSWVWLNAHISEIADQALLYDISVEASADSSQYPLFINAFRRLSNDRASDMTDKLILSENWKLVKAICTSLTPEETDKVINAAAENCLENQEALDIIKTCAAFASKETLHAIIEKAVVSDNWTLIDLLTPHM